MIRIRYLTMLMLLLGSISTWAQDDDFNPASPPEPGQPPMRLQVVAVPAEAGSVSGSGRYVEGAAVVLTAYTNTGFRFVSWTNSAGEELSTSTNFVYTKGAGNEVLTANYEFDPTNPDEPDDPANIMYFQLQVNATEGGTASGGGRYLAGTEVTLRAYTESQFDFEAWIDDATGDVLSTNSTFSYTTTAKHRSITAQFQFNPDNPGEPDEPIVRRTVTATATEGGTTNFSSQRVLIGSSITLTAYANSGYDFDGWYLNGDFYTNLNSFSYTVTDAYGQDFEARFVFNPDSPAEPDMPTTTKHAFFLMNKVTKPGTTIEFPIYLSNVSTIKDMNFQLTFPQELMPDLTKVGMSERATGYTVSYTDNGDGSIVLSLVGGEVPAGNAAVVVFSIPVSDEILTGQNYQVFINQVTVTEEDGTLTTASTRNGRISVYKLGDTNGDNDVNSADVQNIVSVLLNKETDVFIPEVSDINGDDNISITDTVGILNIILNDDSSNSRMRKEAKVE